jgi:hypothetical protein
MPTHTELPALFGRYRIGKKLGEGGMGAVYLAEDTELHRKVAVKVPKLGSAADIQRFQREARTAAAIDHPNVCPVLDIGCIDGIHYLTMPFIDGVPLTEFIPMRPDRAVELVATIARTLQAMHERGHMHRDLKPGNILLKQGREPVLMDFGLARRIGEEATPLTNVGAMVGTPGYMPPEQIQGNRPAMGPGSDVYSLGVILYELLTGRLPFLAESLPELVFKVLSEPPPKPSALRLWLDPALDAICVKAMAKKVEDRFASMAEFAQALEQFRRQRGFLVKSATPPAGNDGTPSLTLNDPRPAPAPEAPRMLPLVCPKCGHKGQTKAIAAGKVVKCPKCKARIPVPAEELPVPPTPPRPALDTLPLPSSRRAMGWLVGPVAVLVLLGLFVGWLVFGYRPDRDANGTGLAATSVPAPPKEMTNSIDMKLVLIKPGKFLMGSPDNEPGREDPEGPQHEVVITQPFYIGVYEVTQGEYEQVMGTNPSCEPPGHRRAFSARSS